MNFINSMMRGWQPVNRQIIGAVILPLFYGQENYSAVFYRNIRILPEKRNSYSLVQVIFADA